MELNQTTIRGILATILSVDEKYVVPKQGNWWNPQEIGTPATWCSYLIRSNRAITAPYYTEINGINYAMTEKIATIDLQFVGEQAEAVAQSVALWTIRDDVETALASVQGSIMYTDTDAVSSNFYQSGNNNIVAWNVTIKILWIYGVETGQGLLPDMNLSGVV